MSMVRVVRVELTYIMKGDNEAALKDGVRSLEHAFINNRSLTASSTGNSEAICAGLPKITVEGL